MIQQVQGSLPPPGHPKDRLGTRGSSSSVGHWACWGSSVPLLSPLPKNHCFALAFRGLSACPELNELKGVISAICLVDSLSGTPEPCNHKHVVLTQEKAWGGAGRPVRPCSPKGGLVSEREAQGGGESSKQIPKRRGEEADVLGAQESFLWLAAKLTLRVCVCEP